MATLTETFTNIANSIRLKTETTDKITPENMPSMIEGITTGGNVMELSITSNGTYKAPEDIDGYNPIIVNVPQDGAPVAGSFELSGELRYAFYGKTWNWVINQYGNQITTKKVEDCKSMFQLNTGITKIPFDINCDNSSRVFIDSMFQGCSNLKELPKIYNLVVGIPSSGTGVFDGCYMLNNIPEDYCDTWDWSVFDTATSSWTSNTNQDYMFRGCNSLRYIPEAFYSHYNPYISNSACIFYFGFADCYVIDELPNLPTYGGSSWTSNAFMRTFREQYRNKRITFRLQEDGSPAVVNWKGQTIDLSDYLGYASSASYITGYNSGLTTATQITDEATYQQLKDNPDSWTTDYKYSRYNRTSAVETINSLPDTSAYLTSYGGTNTIKFKGDSGSLTDGGAINTMTEEEIAVATAKGWTVSFV